MTEPASQDPWSSLADTLGVAPTTEPTPPQAPPSSESSPPPAAPRPKVAAPKPRPTSNWNQIAGELGVEVPPEAEPPPIQQSRPAGPPPIESLVRGSEGKGADQGATGRSERKEVEQRGERPRTEPQRGEQQHGGQQRGQRGEQQRGGQQRGGQQRGGQQRGRERDREDRGSGQRRERTPRSNHGESGRGRRGGQERTSGGYREQSRPAPRETRDDREGERRYDRRDADEAETPATFAFDSSEQAREERNRPDLEALRLEDSILQEEESRLEREAGDPDDFSEPHATEESGSPTEASPPSRRRRRRRGHRGVLREDAFLGIERLATEDIVHREPPTPASASESLDETELDDEGESSEEIQSIEIGGREGTAPRPGSEESDDEPRRRRRRRRGRRSKERGEKQPDRDDADDQEMDFIDDEKDRGDEIEGRESSRGEPRRTSSDEDGDQDEQEDGARSNKNLHREVTPWAEAIGFIVNSNLEARARAPSGGAPRGRWTKGDRRG